MGASVGSTVGDGLGGDVGESSGGAVAVGGGKGVRVGIGVRDGRGVGVGAGGPGSATMTRLITMLMARSALRAIKMVWLVLRFWRLRLLLLTTNNLLKICPDYTIGGIRCNSLHEPYLACPADPSTPENPTGLPSELGASSSPRAVFL
jgi:hypothetical protein